MAESDFANDPAALAWARGHVERDVAKLRGWEREAADKGDAERAMRWRRIANFLQREYVGGTGCVIAAFDERRPALNARVRAEDAADHDEPAEGCICGLVPAPPCPWCEEHATTAADVDTASGASQRREGGR